MFKEWLNHHHYHWQFIEQSPHTFAERFGKDGFKRPDFLIKTMLGEFVVDVKLRWVYSSFNSVQLDSDELAKYHKYADFYNQPLWFAFQLDGGDLDEFYWISFQDVMNKTVERISSESGKPFRPIPLNLCTKIKWDENLSKLMQ